ncbi:hypothetical protein QM735_00765 [Rhodococcus ruber]|uniref:Minor tail protein n=1 Tax=Rhodococcus ruber TaxID=1830 RepID=A0A098BVP9_9NOCA|nr:hypothetical protein [Rhodococcus ruber]MDI9985716.1 hypothetical protein [Rhodococcus ruber]CDZ92310.1 conserved hypothetical protein [Rhodococcus ruber]
MGIKLEVTNTYGGFGKLVNDQRLNAGSLILIDPAHPVSPWSAGVPSGSVPNLAAPMTALTVGAGAETLPVTNTIAAGSGLVERTSKGGLHVIMSKTASVAAQVLTLDLTTALMTYLNANPGHSLFLSAWGRTTRARTIGSGPAAIPLVGLRSTSTSTFTPWTSLYHASSGNIATDPGTSNTNYIGRTVGTLSSGLGSFRADLGITSRAASWVSTLNTRFVELGNALSTATNHAPSQILYAVCLEDLTVSGRSYIEASQMDAALYAQAFGAGGRYASDTFTNPTTLP